MVNVIVHDGSVLIKNEIKLKARSRIREMEKETKAKIEKMNCENELKVEKIKKEILDDAKRRAVSEAKKIDAKTNVEIKRLILEAKEEIINETFFDAMRYLEKFDPKKIKEELSGILLRGVKECRGKRITIISNKATSGIFDARTLERIKKRAGRKIKLEKRTKSMSGGVILHDDENNMYLDYSFDSIFKIKEDKIRNNVSKILFK